MNALPLVYMSTESAIKHRAIAAVMERIGIPVRVEGKKLDSGVEEQPLSLDETYVGAKNRHEGLRRLGIQAEYLATVESGLHRVRDEFGMFGCVAVIIEKVGGETYTGFSLDVEYPDEILQVVPSKYADVGVWAQQVLGAKEKDPYAALSGGIIARQDTIEAAATNAAARLVRERV